MGDDRVVGWGGRDRLLVGLVVLVGQLGLTPRAGAVVALTPSRREMLSSADANPDCSKLSQLADDALPLNVVRIHATVDGGPPPGVIRWSLPRPQVGTLAADQDLGSAEQTAAVRGLCAEFGNACVLTEDKLPFYNRPTILWIAPTCAMLPLDTTRAFRGATVKVGVSVTNGKSRLKSTTTVGYGRTAAVTLFVDGRDGLGVPGGIPSDIEPFLGAIVSPNGVALPGPGTFEFDDGGEASASVGACTDSPPPGDRHTYDACVGGLLYQQAGKFTATVQDSFDDGSALCDNLAVRVLSAKIIPRLEVKARPAGGTYVPGDPVHGSVNLRVTLHNDSPRQGGSGILLLGSNVLTCSAEVKVGGTSSSVQTTFDTQHCSVTNGQGCQTAAECRSPRCAACTVGETCLTQSHCSKTLGQLCSGDVGCKAAACPACEDGESCVRVLATPSIAVPIGGQVELVNTIVEVANQFPGKARITDTWTVNTFNAGSDEAALSYRIRGSGRAPAP